MSIKTFHIDSRGLVVEANGMDGTWVATSDYKALLATCNGTGQTITAQHDETGRLWRGPRGALPKRYHEISQWDLPPCDCAGMCVRGPRSNQPPLGRRCKCDGELIKST